MTHRVELLWFSDCPNHPVARQMLADAIERLAPGTKIEEVDASDPEVAAARCFPGSPTIRVDGLDIEPGFADPRDYSRAAGSTGRPRVCAASPTPPGSRRHSADNGRRQSAPARAASGPASRVPHRGLDVIEGVVAIAAALVAGSMAFMGVWAPTPPSSPRRARC